MSCGGGADSSQSCVAEVVVGRKSVNGGKVSRSGIGDPPRRLLNFSSQSLTPLSFVILFFDVLEMALCPQLLFPPYLFF